MNPPLSDIESRVLGCLLEKQMTTPEYYPLTLNSLVTACNQKTARNPVTQYEDGEVLSTVESLRERQLTIRCDVAGSRVAKYRHQLENFSEALEKKHCALLCVLLLRGPQTLGELRARTERLYLFRDIAAVEETMTELAAWSDPEALVVELPREPGRKESRFAQCFSALPEPQAEAQPVTATPAAPVSEKTEERLAELEANQSVLQAEISQLKKDFEVFRQQFE